MIDDVGLGRARARRWWVSGRRIRSVKRAGAFIDDVGFALLFPSERVLVPSLWETVADDDAEPFATGMDANEQRVWSWKDELPKRGLAWYGTFITGRGSFLSPAMLGVLYPASGEVGDHEELDLSATAREIVDALANGPLPSATLRALVGERNRYQRAAVELQRQLLITKAGVQAQPAGWPSAVLDLTCRRFDVGGGPDRTHAAQMFVDTVLSAAAADLARVFRWPVAEARTCLDSLVDSGLVLRGGGQYLAPSMHF